MNAKLKKLFSSIIDLIIGIIVFFIISLTLSNLIVTKCTNYNYLVKENNDILLNTGLYKEEDNNIVFIDNNIDEKLIIFYQNHDYIDIDNKYMSYEEAKEKSGLFEKVNGIYVIKNNVDENELNNFYEQELYNASISIANTKEYKENKKKLDFINTCNAFITLFSVSFICLFIIPLCNKKRKTIGNYIMKLRPVSESGDISIGALIIRLIAFFAVELIPSLTFYGIPLCITLIMMMFSKQNKYVHDYFAFTYLVDDVKE